MHFRNVWFSTVDDLGNKQGEILGPEWAISLWQVVLVLALFSYGRPCMARRHGSELDHAGPPQRECFKFILKKENYKIKDKCIKQSVYSLK